ncbi:MAG TPA: hypothetical protein VIN35_10725 [Hydrogenophaga sp.]
MQPVPSPFFRGVRRRAFTVATAFVVPSLIAACGGGGSDGSGGGDGLFMRATIDGRVVEYRQFAVAALYPYQGKADGLLVAGAVAGSQTYPSMALQVIDPQGLATKTYLENDYGPGFRFSPKADEHYVSGLGASKDFKVTITSLSGGIMRGTFSGTVKDEASEGRNVSWAVTNGAFALEIRRP